MKINSKNLFFIFYIILLVILLHPLSLEYTKTKVFGSPDENSNYIFMKNYAENGKLYIDSKSSKLDINNLYHFRLGISKDDRIVFGSFIGTPLFYGPIYLFIKEEIIFINYFLSVIIIFFMYK